jgi:hypothetical protein
VAIWMTVQAQDHMSAAGVRGVGMPVAASTAFHCSGGLRQEGGTLVIHELGVCGNTTQAAVTQS